MDFKDKLNYYIKQLNITSKQLSNKSNISESVISRYKKGERREGSFLFGFGRSRDLPESIFEN